MMKNFIKKWFKPQPIEKSIEQFIPVELFNVDQMERHAVVLASSHVINPKLGRDILLHRLAKSETTLIYSCKQLIGKSVNSFSPAREWLLDNFYLIQEKIQTIRHDLPKEYGRTLPQLAGNISGYPRVYDIALEIIEHSDGHWSLENLTRFISSYQTIQPLTLGELWAIPITLGIALIENLSKASTRVLNNKNASDLANYWVDKMIEVALSEPKKLVIVIADMARTDPQMNSSFVAELARRLQGAALSLPLSWVEQRLAEDGLTIEQLVHEENKLQAANQVSVSNCIASLRRLSKVNWREFVENMSVVNTILSTDPSNTYIHMDFATRDRYRHVIERIARRSKCSEQKVANTAIQLAQEQVGKYAASNKIRYAHVGYYLVDVGLIQLKRKLDLHLRYWEQTKLFFKRHALAMYLGSILLITSGLVYLLINQAAAESPISEIWLWVMGIALAIYGSQLALALVNLVVTWLVKPRLLPRMDFSKKIPKEFRSLVVVPCMLANITQIEGLVEALEVRFLGNRDPHLHFMLLSDFNDAPQQMMPQDQELLHFAQRSIAELNLRYPQKESDIFLLCHRPRHWNASENTWMGEERKRGKLADLNNLLCTDSNAFSLIEGRTHILKEIKYVITLDTDTQLSRESAYQLVATMAHPLNRPGIDEEKQCVVEGYGILQPRVSEALPFGTPSRYLWLFNNEFGIDPYTKGVSSVYQDLFHAGSFVGKGIYDVGAFQQVLNERFPNNQILSHDLLEGCYLNSGFLSDVPVYERSPGNYLADIKRRIRWIRGDWQISGWLFSTVLDGRNKRVRNPLSLLSKWKIFDNLRRGLVPIALMTLFILSWTILPTTGHWLAIIFGMAALPTVVKKLIELARKPSNILSIHYANSILPSIQRLWGQFVIYLACLPHEAWYNFAAILRTFWRMHISKRHLLEWTPSDMVDKRLRGSLDEWISNLWIGPAVAIIGFIGLSLMNNGYVNLLLALPLLLLWFISPLIARWFSQPFKQKDESLTPVQMRFLHRITRKTWHFFENFVTVEDNWLPPDNYQEKPIALARRTSPTNIGLSLLANLTAYDFGYLNIPQLLNRTNNTLASMAKLEKYRGHLYNWYNTETLEPLSPRYVSMVDSGNLAGHLLILRQGLLALADAPLLRIRYLDGLEDTSEMLTAQSSKIISALDHFKNVLKTTRNTFTNWPHALMSCNNLCEAAKKIAMLDNSEWPQKLVLQCEALCAELQLFTHIPDLSPQVNLRYIAKLPVTEATDAIIQEAKKRLAWIDNLSLQAFAFSQLDINFLYDEASHLLSIGFNIENQTRDPSYYDLLSSEARLGIFVAIAQGQLSQESWFALGRLLVNNHKDPVLVSWSGSMFEYLMPLLVMPTYPGTLLDQTYHSAVNEHINFGNINNIPWGISESGYNAVDSQFNYQYQAFGVPGLGLKRDLEDNLVVAPYASVMALMVSPKAATLNLARLAKEEMIGDYGFYEAIDYTPSRLPRDSKKAIIASFMAHHQGMSLLAFSYLLHDQPMQKRFLTDPLFQSTILLLQERIPKSSAAYLKMPKSLNEQSTITHTEVPIRIFTDPDTNTPQVHLLSNARYHLMLTQAGGSYTRWHDIAITRWREDTTCDNWGLFSYIRDVDTGEYWSTSYQPTPGKVSQFKAVFSEGHAEYTRREKSLVFHTEIVVSPEDDIELRRLRIFNWDKMDRVIEFTSYGEIVLAAQVADLAQPAFNNLFIETELLIDQHAILATRRTQDKQQNSPWLCHKLNVYDDEGHAFSFETDRVRFIGRDHDLAHPLAMLEPGDLSNTQGAVLDPIISIRCRVTIKADSAVTFDLFTGMAETRSQCVALVEKYQDRNLANRIFRLAWTHGQVLLHQLNISEEHAQLYEKLAGSIIYANNNYRGEANIIMQNHRGQSGLWGYSISGDLPIILLYIEDSSNVGLAQQLIQAQLYWRSKGLYVDLVIFNKEQASYRQPLQEQIMHLLTTNVVNDRIGNIVVRIADQVPTEDHILLQSVARVILYDKRGSLKEQLNRNFRNLTPVPDLKIIKLAEHASINTLETTTTDLQFFNGLGGFNTAGDEYIIQLNNAAKEKSTPAPWINILANPLFGTLISECGQGYTWIENAREFRLTPWGNDAVQDSSGEAYYLRDEDTGVIWSPTALPCRGKGEYQTRHGFGYTVFEHMEDGIHSELWVYVALDEAIKFSVLKVRNDSGIKRHLSATGFVSWVLGDTHAKNAMHVITELSESGAVLAQNNYNTEFGQRTAFYNAYTTHINLSGRSVTGDRKEFIGRNGTLKNPAVLKRKHLSGRVGAALDPCAAIQLNFELANNQTREIVFTLGAGQDKADAENIIQRFKGKTPTQNAFNATRLYWQNLLKTTQVYTPEPALNILANGWLLYQVLSSRIWGRSGYYQSGGAFGFRDQLQDVMALPLADAKLFREHILRCAAHQFEAGDVQHWWHPPQNRGVRTRCSDDYLWLPYAICQYIETTDDKTILDEIVPFLSGRSLNDDEESYYDLPTISSEKASLYQHAVRAITHGLRFGVHGLPLIGSGDWNDGMNLVGKEGKGESIWLGFFLYTVLQRFAPLATSYNDLTFAQRCKTESQQLQQQLEVNGWDGEWYRRAYFDNGTPLGSANNKECRIDSIAQSWSVLSKAGSTQRTKQAMASLYKHLVSEADGIIKLLDPPFNDSNIDPGYIQGYLPGIRENGGQYTQGAIWAAMAFAELGDKERAWKLFRILNPINHGRTTEEVNRYKIEPYVVAADIYSVAPHIGCGGWSWYTGSAGWLYRLITETLLGIHLRAGNQLHITPLLPDDWDNFSIEYHYQSSSYTIYIQRAIMSRIEVDNIVIEGNIIILQDDGKKHIVQVFCSI